MEAVAGSAAAGVCPACGRRYVPARPSCAYCRRALVPDRVRDRARVLARTRVHRAARAALISPPYVVAWLREDDDGAVFLAPLDGDAAAGNTVAVELRTWATEDGDTFTGVVGIPEPA